MDQLKSFANKLGSSSSNNNAAPAAAATGNTNATAAPGAVGGEPSQVGAGTGTGTTGTGNAAAKEDYLDKGFDAIGKKFGYSGNRETNEKITDFAREKFEGASGKKVPEKFSN